MLIGDNCSQDNKQRPPTAIYTGVTTGLFRLVVTVIAVSSAPKALWVVMIILKMQCVRDNRLASTVSKLFRS